MESPTRSLRSAAVATALLALAGLAGPGTSGCVSQVPAGRVVHEAAAPLSFATFPFRQGQALAGALEPLAAYLEESLHRRVRFRLVGSYAELEELVNSGHVDFGWFTPRSAPAGASAARMELLVRPRTDVRTSYRGMIVARKDTGAKTLADLAGRSFAYVDRSSNSGFVYPNRALRAGGLDPLVHFSEVHFAGNHDRVVEGILAGLYAAGAASEIAVKDPERAARVARELTVLAATDELTPDPLVVRADLAPEVKAALRAAFIQAPRSPSGVLALGRLSGTLGIEGFEAADATPDRTANDKNKEPVEERGRGRATPLTGDGTHGREGSR